jgi:enamine deaminase RidA (YjgF/YER057c/UK114 family)
MGCPLDEETLAVLLVQRCGLALGEKKAGFYAVRDEIFPTLFPDGKYPANTLLIISRLVKPELFVEIEAIGHA